ncbi:hypothetical protein Zm00014a_009075 [Zea mays]|uniref:Uncharacterized protein n=1 Tax=Zea mays TaxID=4577 RepID=A0A3L6EEJ8_MAIZE|nr:hypothetical protein Zm00014a_009075 [Zea mays]
MELRPRRTAEADHPGTRRAGMQGCWGQTAPAPAPDPRPRSCPCPEAEQFAARAHAEAEQAYLRARRVARLNTTHICAHGVAGDPGGIPDHAVHRDAAS